MTSCNRRPSHRRRTFRRALLVAIAAIGLVVGAAVPALAVNPESSRFYEDAVGRLERNDVAGAIIQLNNALQKDPSMLAAHVLLGKARLKNDDPAGAESSFEKALKLGVDRAEVALPLAQAYAAQGKYEVLLERIIAGGPAAAEPDRDSHPAWQRAGGHGQDRTGAHALIRRGAGARSPVDRGPVGAGERAGADRSD